MAIIKWITIEKLSGKPLLELWELLEDIEDNLEIVDPLNSISIPLLPEKCNTKIQKKRHCKRREQLLEELEKTEEVLEILHKPNQDIDFAYIKVNKNKFYSFYEKVQEGIEKSDQKIIPDKLSPFLNAKWEDITIQFVNGHEVIIKIKKKVWHTTYEEMGFKDKRTKLPNRQWEFLKNLSKTNGEISWKNPIATVKGKKQKQLLSDKLKKYFKINEKPFHCDRKEKMYKIKINLIAETKSTPSPKKEKGIKESIKELHEEQCPEVYEK